MSHLSSTAMAALNGVNTFVPAARTGRDLDADGFAFVRDRRAKGWGWQAIAQQIGMNVITLRIACGDLKAAEAELAQCAPTARRNRREVLRVGSLGARFLLLIAHGVRDRRVMAATLERPIDSITQAAHTLRNKGLITLTWLLTEDGELEVESLNSRGAVADA